MKIKGIKEEQTTLELLDSQYFEADNKEKLDFWAPLSNIILESLSLRDAKGMTQADLAKEMETRQSVISRFENMGRLPSYKFFAKLASAFGHAPGMTLYGDYMAVVPLKQQAWIKEMADRKKVPTRRFVQNLLDESLASRSEQKQYDATKGEIPRARQQGGSHWGVSEVSDTGNPASKTTASNTSPDLYLAA